MPPAPGWTACSAKSLGQNDAHNVRLVKGSHIVVRRLFDHDRCYFFQNADGRIIFAIPYERDFTLIGTTDQDFTGDPRGVRISDEETTTCCAAASEYFDQPGDARRDRLDLFRRAAAVRRPQAQAQEATRDYVLTLEGDAATGALINVFGGKLTTHRRLAEEVLEHIEEVLGKTRQALDQGQQAAGRRVRVRSSSTSRSSGSTSSIPTSPTNSCAASPRQYGTRAATLLGERQAHAAIWARLSAPIYASARSNT